MEPGNVTTVFPRLKAAATIILMCQSAAATVRGWPQFKGGYYNIQARAR